MSLWYRVRQFQSALLGAPSKDELSQLDELLDPNLLALFNQMQPSEQAHSLRVYRQLIHNQETHPELLKAALLHDVGKSRYPLKLWERVIIVLGNIFFPERVIAWGKGDPAGWKRAFVVAQQHPIWGAEMVARAGGSPLCSDLIRHHQDSLSETIPSAQYATNDLLKMLQSADNQN